MRSFFYFYNMQSFLEEVVKDLWKKRADLEDIVFVLPNKRAGTFLRNTISKITHKTQFSPEIFSIEVFVEKLSGLKYASHTEQLFLLYKAYLKITTGEKDNFSAFSKWGQIVLQDFNEIDRHLIDRKKIFSYLSEIQEIDHWYLSKEKTKMMEDYIHFWNNLDQLCNNLNDSLLEKGMGHQGFIYRKATQKLSEYLENSKSKKHVFIGFNALNAAETYIIQKILEKSDADIYWDTDPYFIDDPLHDAGFFIRQYYKDWRVLKGKATIMAPSNYLSKKNIKIVGVPKNVSQTKYVGTLLKELIIDNHEFHSNVAIVLGDENLLNPLLNSIPNEITHVNITMGYPLKKIPLASLFLQFIELYLHREEQGWPYKNVLALLSHPYIHILLAGKTQNSAITLSEGINTKNWLYVSPENIGSLVTDKTEHIAMLFFSGAPTSIVLIEKCLSIILDLKGKITESGNPLEREYLHRFYSLFNTLKEMVKGHSFLSDLKSLQSLYNELLSFETLDFQGEPLEGLQIMGMLETRNLDFETVIITSVNEGILPSGKSNNSFIPYDVKRMFGLPTYKEKDAIYTYHFYRLLQRAKNVYIIYNTEPDVLEGREKSRLIGQLLTDGRKLKDITEIIAAPAIEPSIKILGSIPKNGDLMEIIKIRAGTGFSPTSLANYIRNPMDFYKKTILKIDAFVEVEETVASNTFGTIIHDTLEELYLPFIDNYLTPEGLAALKPKIKQVVKNNFSKSYADGDIARGKNLIAFNVVTHYIENFIKLEIVAAKEHKIKILGLEKKLTLTLDIPEIGFPVLLKGKLDRIDSKDGTLRIIDYKTGATTRSQVKISDWDTLITDYGSCKAFQLLCYALMYSSKFSVTTMEAGIISFKSLGLGAIMFTDADKKRENNMGDLIDEDTLMLFYSKLKELILEICDPAVPFQERDIS